MGGADFLTYFYKRTCQTNSATSSLLFLSVLLGPVKTQTASSQPWGKILTLLCRKLWDSIHLYIRITFSKDSVPRPHRLENTQWQLEQQVTIETINFARLCYAEAKSLGLSRALWPDNAPRSWQGWLFFQRRSPWPRFCPHSSSTWLIDSMLLVHHAQQWSKSELGSDLEGNDDDSTEHNMAARQNAIRSLHGV